MRIWFDADNAPHVLVMKPLAEELSSMGHQVKFTARDRTGTCSLLNLYGIEHIKVGKEYPKSMLGKIVGTLLRASRLAYTMRKWKPDVSFGHGSRSLPLASFLLGVPSVTMYDYEWVNPSIFNRFCKKILLPDAISIERCTEAGIRLKKIVFFPGFKEHLYLGETKRNPEIAHELGLREDKIKVLLRPPATNAHYHNPDAEKILEALLEKLLQDARVQLIWVPRTPDQNSYIHHSKKAEIITPDNLFSGPELIIAMDMVIGGGGTMTREAAILGVKSVSFFRGAKGAVDERLEQDKWLSLLGCSLDVINLQIEKQTTPMNPVENVTRDLIKKICQSIITV